MFAETAYDLWEALKQTYFGAGNMSTAFDIRQKIHEKSQGEKIVTQYYAELTALWQELYHYWCFTPKNLEDATNYRQFIEDARVFDFLAGLRMEFDHIRSGLRSQILFPSLRDDHARIQ